MKKLLLYIACVLLIASAFVSCTNKRNGIPSLSETFSKKDKEPFGTFVLFNQLEQLYYHNSIKEVKRNFESFWRSSEDTGAVYINISQNLFLSKADLEGMLAFVYNGNTVFISSNRIDKRLLDTLNCGVNKDNYEQFRPEMKYTAVELTPGIYNDSKAYKYFYLPFYNHFSKFDSKESVVLGKNTFGTNYVVTFFGKGRFYLHTEPRALSNYFLLQKDNYNYLHQVFSFTPAIPEHVYWDDYYNKINFRSNENSGKSTFSVILKYPGMAWAFWLSLLMAVLYTVFGGKRRQRIVEPLPANTNTTLAFTETIGRLYLQKKDNRNIADKLITYFMEHIRNQYYLNTSHLNDEFIATLARKANHTQESVDSLFGTIRSIQQSAQISDQQLLLLNQQLENFYKTKT